MRMLTLFLQRNLGGGGRTTRDLEGLCQCRENPVQVHSFPRSWLVETVPEEQGQDVCPTYLKGQSPQERQVLPFLAQGF